MLKTSRTYGIRRALLEIEAQTEVDLRCQTREKTWRSRNAKGTCFVWWDRTGLETVQVQSSSWAVHRSLLYPVNSGVLSEQKQLEMSRGVPVAESLPLLVKPIELSSLVHPRTPLSGEPSCNRHLSLHSLNMGI
jgi:hypothetical protein